MAVRNEELKELIEKVIRLQEQNISMKDDLEEVRADMYGNGKRGLKADVQRINNFGAAAVAIFSFFILVTQGMTACNAVSTGIHVQNDSQNATSVASTLQAIGGVGGGAIEPAHLATPTRTPKPSPTSSIIEVTPSAISERPAACVIDIDKTLQWPSGWVYMESCAYQPYPSQLNIRAQPGADQKILGMAGVRYAVDTMGYARWGVGQIWICLKAYVDPHGAMVCEGAMIYRDDKGKLYGAYKKK